MNDEQLNKIQEDSFRRHIDAHFNFYNGALKPRKQIRKIKEKKVMPDLMASEIPLPCTSDKKTEPSTMNEPTRVWPTIFDKPHVPKPVQEKKKLFAKVFAPDPPQNWERPKAEYSNSKSPYGIYDELKAGTL